MYLHEEILLLALQDESGTADWKAGLFHFSMAGALLVELLLDDWITLSGDKHQHIQVSNSKRHKNLMLNEALEIIKHKNQEKDLQHWVTTLSAIKDIKEKTARGLCEQGILIEEEQHVLFVFSRKAYPTVNPEPEENLIARIEDAVLYDGEIDIRTTLFISLAHHADMLPIVFSHKELRDRKQRILDISNGNLIGQHTGDVTSAVSSALEVVCAIPAMSAASHAVISRPEG